MMKNRPTLIDLLCADCGEWLGEYASDNDFMCRIASTEKCDDCIQAADDNPFGPPIESVPNLDGSGPNRHIDRKAWEIAMAKRNIAEGL